MDAYEIRTVWVLIGIPASGKSTWSLEQLRKYPGKYKRTNRDSLRAMLDGDAHDWDNEKFVVNLRDTIIERSLRKGFDVIVDDTNFKSTNWTEICAIAKRVENVRVVEKYFPIELKEAQERNSKRPKPVPPEVVGRFFNKYVKGKHIQTRDEFFPISLPVSQESDPTKKDAIICDIDNTIALCTNRNIFDLSMVLEDIPNQPICNLVRIFKEKGYSIIILSGREDKCQKDTETWLKVNDIPYDLIFMRKSGDFRKDAIIKEEIFRKEIELKYTVLYALDDRNSVVALWRSIGIPCLQVNYGDF